MVQKITVYYILLGFEGRKAVEEGFSGGGAAGWMNVRNTHAVLQRISVAPTTRVVIFNSMKLYPFFYHPVRV